MKGLVSVLCMWFMLGLLLESTINAFTNDHQQRWRISSSTSNTVLGSGDLFASFRNFFGGEGNGDNKSEDETSNDVAAGSSLIASIPVRSIKPGGLRLFLMFYLMGMQNTPDRKFWRADQPSSDDYVLEMLYHDLSGMITIELTEEEVLITRCGSVPSTAYLMHETTIVQGVLDELDQCAFDESVAEENRLLVPTTPDGIDMARSSLSFG